MDWRDAFQFSQAFWWVIGWGGGLVLGGRDIGLSNPECGRDGFPVSCGYILLTGVFE